MGEHEKFHITIPIILVGLLTIGALFFFVFYSPSSQPDVATTGGDGEESVAGIDGLGDGTEKPTWNTASHALIHDDLIGSYFTAAETGMTLYMLRPGAVCDGTCLENWTPYMADGPAENSVRLSDGSHQYTWNDQPLYFFKNDKVPGDLLGDGYDLKWKIARP